MASPSTVQPSGTNTPIVVNIYVQSQASLNLTADAAGTAIAATASGPLSTASPTPSEMPLQTPVVTATGTPEPIAGHRVALTPIPTDAVTGLTATGLLTDTTVPPEAGPIQLPPGTTNIALLGVDSRPAKGFANTDVIIIASINPDVPSVTMLSIPRDTLVYIPGWRSNKINTAFAHGGPDLFKRTIRYNFGINVDYYAMVNFAAVVHAVQTLGDVDVVATCPLQGVFPKDPYYMADDTSPLTVTQPYTDTFTGDVWQPGTAVPTQTIDIPGAGVYRLNGMEALAYVRVRYNVPGGDIDRGRREQRMVRALFLKAMQVNAIAKVPQLWALFRQDMQTDLTLQNIVSLAGLAGRFDDAVIHSYYLDPDGLTQVTLPDIGYVLIPNRETMPAYIRRSLFVALNQRPNDGIPIEVWNGTGARDFGIVAADRLAELGFRVVHVQQADRLYPRTVVIDFTTTHKGSAVPLLQRTFGLKDDQIVAQPNPDGPRYRVIAGPDFNPCYYANRGPDQPALTVQ